jgi:type IV pilus assembly protein PilC
MPENTQLVPPRTPTPEPERASGAAPLAVAAPPERIRLNAKQLAFFNRQLASMARLNMPLAKGLRIMAREVSDHDFRTLIEGVQKDLEEGRTLEESLARYPKSFSAIYVELLRAGETTGNLAVVLDELTRYTETLHRVRTRLRDAMLYPAVVLGLTFFFALFFFWMLVPNFKSLYWSAGLIGPDGELNPAVSTYTRWIFAASDFLRNPLTIIFGFTLGGMVAWFGFQRIKRGWEGYDDFMFRLPLFGELVKMATLLKVTRTLRDLLVNGVSMVNSLRLTARVAGNNRIRRKLEEIRGAVEEGQSFSKALTPDVFPETLIWKLQMGEEKGIVEDALGEIATEVESDLDSATSYLAAVISPLMLLCMALVLMFLMAPVYTELLWIASKVGR